MMCIHVLLHHYIYVLCVYSSTIIGVFESELQLLALIFFHEGYSRVHDLFNFWHATKRRRIRNIC